MEHRNSIKTVKANLKGAWHVFCIQAGAMDLVLLSLPKRTRREIFMSVLLIVGIALAIIVPTPSRTVSEDHSHGRLFTLVEGDYQDPLFSDVSLIHVLSGAGKEVARFAGYDEFKTRLDLESGATVARVTRCTGGLFSMLNIRFALRDKDFHELPIIFISESFWARAFGRRPDILETTVKMHQMTYRVAGVTTGVRGFLQSTDIWVPVRKGDSIAAINSMKVLGYLLETGDWRTAQQELTAAFRKYLGDAAYAETRGARLLPISDGILFRDQSPAIAANFRARLNSSRRLTIQPLSPPALDRVPPRNHGRS
jgi:hypothetical protein